MKQPDNDISIACHKRYHSAEIIASTGSTVACLQSLLAIDLLPVTGKTGDNELRGTNFQTCGMRKRCASDGADLFRDTEPKAGSYRCAFDAEGRLVTSSYDGQLRLYTAGRGWLEAEAVVLQDDPRLGGWPWLDEM